MKTLKETLLAAAAALDAMENPDYIKVWPFHEAPCALQELSEAGGDEGGGVVVF